MYCVSKCRNNELGSRGKSYFVIFCSTEEFAKKNFHGKTKFGEIRVKYCRKIE